MDDRTESPDGDKKIVYISNDDAGGRTDFALHLAQVINSE